MLSVANQKNCTKFDSQIAELLIVNSDVATTGTGAMSDRYSTCQTYVRVATVVSFCTVLLQACVKLFRRNV